MITTILSEIGTIQLSIPIIIVGVSSPVLYSSSYPFSEHLQESSQLKRQKDLKQRRDFYSREKQVAAMSKPLQVIVVRLSYWLSIIKATSFLFSPSSLI